MQEKNNISPVRSQVLTAVSMKFRVVRDLVQCSHGEIYRPFKVD
jgi:hypothetical protein